MTSPRLLFACALALSVSACGGRMISDVDGGGGGGVDAGPGVDSGPAPIDDAGGGGTDSGMTTLDGGSPDPIPTCDCPDFPTTCTPPMADAPAFTPEAGSLEQLFDVIACADGTLDIAIYRGSWECIVEGINTQLERDADLQVRVIVDNEDCETGSCIAEMLLPTDRVTVVRDGRIGNLMHHKVVIADGVRAWIGSANFTQRSFCGDHNNSIVVEQADILARLQTEYDRMAGGDFSPLSDTDGAPTTGGMYTLYFSPVSPQSNPAVWFEAMRAAIASATTSIDVMTNAWTRSELANDMLDAADRGVTIRALVSDSYADDLPAQVLAMEGADVRRGAFHDKVMIIDGRIVITGSANWSMNAWSNNENQLWIDDATIAAAYTAEVDRVFPTAEVVEYMP